MKRAILVTTGTVVGVASVLAYKPDAATLGLIPGTESLVTASGVRSGTAVGAADPVAADTASANGGTTSDPASPATTSSTSATASAGATATASASATSSRAAAGTASATPASTATATATPAATPTSSAGNASIANVADGTYSGAVRAVESHGHNYGSLVATVMMSDGRMTELSFSQSPSGRNEQFISAVNTYLVPEILRTQNITVGIVTGATGTSMALIASLQDALGLA